MRLIPPLTEGTPAQSHDAQHLFVTSGTVSRLTCNLPLLMCMCGGGGNGGLFIINPKGSTARLDPCLGNFSLSFS